MFNFIHRLTCKHREVHLLLPPQSLPITKAQKRLGPWTEFSIGFKRRWNLSMEAWDERRSLSAPTPGPKDASIGLQSPNANQDCDHQYTHRGGSTWVCFKCGSVIGIKPHGY